MKASLVTNPFARSAGAKWASRTFVQNTGGKQMDKEKIKQIIESVQPRPAPPPVDRSKRVLTDGSPVPEDQSHTKLRTDGQQKGYIVLTEEERRKGFIRPVRRSYRHVGIRPKYPLRDLTPEEAERYKEFGYVKFEIYPESESPKTGRYWTQKQLDSGCGTVTTMALSIAETYARDNKFYSHTFCCHCGTHPPVGEDGEFVWVDDGTKVGT